MDSSTRGSLTLAACLAVSVSIVTGLQCYSCVYFKLESSNQDANRILQGGLPNSNEECKANVNRNTEGVVIQDCPTPGTGKKSFCGKVDATVDMLIVTVDVKFAAVTRGCFEAASDKQDGCVKPSDEDKNKFQALYGTAATISALDGTSCGCSSDLCNGQQKVTARTLCWLAGLLLAFSARQLW